MEEIAPGLWHWTAPHPRIHIDVSSYFLPEHALLLDPLVPNGGLERLEELEHPREILLTNRHHWRDCSRLIERFGCTVRAPRVGMHEFSPDQPVEPYDFGDSLLGDTVYVHEVGGICPDESALHVPAASALAVADGVIHYRTLGFVPDYLMDDPEDTKLALKKAYAGLADELEFEHLLTAHGEPVVGGAREALRDFAASRATSE
jgi:glyoxylase-like metal-dependent hydrolase (beta-lactamase superfamily II)